MDTTADIKKMLDAKPLGLDIASQTDNYTLFSQMQKDGVKLRDLVNASEERDAYKRKLDEIGKKVVDLEQRIKQQSQTDVRTYEMMYRDVKDDTDVKDAHEATARQKSIAIHNLCLGDNAYRTTYDAERIAVENAYRVKVEHDGKEVEDKGRIGPGE